MAETNNKDGRWVTLDNGVHLFIKKGQTLDDAIEKLNGKPEKPGTTMSEKSVKKLAKKEGYTAEETEKYIKNREDEGYTHNQAKKKFLDDVEKDIKEGKNPKEKVEKSAKDVVSGKKDTNAGTYKGYTIEKDFYGDGEYSVQYAGDDYLFVSEAEAKKFIDGIKDSEEDEKLSAREIAKKYARKNERINDYTDQINESLGIGDLEEVEKNIKKDFLGGALTREERDKLLSQIDEAKEGYRQGAENYKKGIIEIHGHRWKEDKNGEIKSVQASDGHILKIGDKVSGYKITGFDPWTNSVLIDGSDYSVEDIVSEITGKQYNDEISEEERKINSKRTNKK